MNDSETIKFAVPAEQQVIRDKCFHPSGRFVEFPINDIETSIPARFEKIVELYPNRLAFKCGNRVATYGEINRLANQCAHALAEKLGFDAEPVGVFLGNGVSLFAAIFGILKVGKFVVSVDPTLPPDRAEAIFADSQVRLIITDGANEPTASPLNRQAARLNLDSLDCSISEINLYRRIPATTPAFLVYTSGSTGTPKSIIQDHRNRLHTVADYVNVLHLCPDDRVSLLTSGTTNAIGNSLRALLCGASLHAFDVKRYGVAALANWLPKERITVSFIGVSLFRELFRTLKSEELFGDLRVVGLRSEAMLPGDIVLYKKHCPAHCLLANNYSSSETNTLTMNFFDHSSKVREDAVPIGYAVKDKEIFVVDDQRIDLGFNQVGEIAVRSRYIYPGYWKNPELTAAKFKADPQDPDKLVYFTGDLGLILPDGCLIHKGRKDFRLKIRGYGVDLIEVEQALLKHPDIKDAGVRAWDREEGEKYLAGYSVLREGTVLNAGEVREFLKNKLPDYMIPTVFKFTEALPLTNGKVDRNALPEPGEDRPQLSVEYIAPGSGVESMLTEIWAEALQLNKVGVRDDFFELGGHSLAGAQIITRVKDEFGLEFTIGELLEFPTVAKMAERVGGPQNRVAEARLRNGNYLSNGFAKPDEPAQDSSVGFSRGEVEGSIPGCFAMLVRTCLEPLAVKRGSVGDL